MNPESCEQACGDYREKTEEEFWQETVANGNLKSEINEFVFLKGNPRLTLGQAEDIACKFYEMLIYRKE